MAGCALYLGVNMVVLLVIFSLLAAAVGGLLMSNATSGVGIICGACLLAILARIAQASEHRADIRDLYAQLKELNEREVKRDQRVGPAVGPDGWAPPEADISSTRRG